MFNPGVCNYWGSCLAHSPAWQLLTAELLVSMGDQAWIKKTKKRKRKRKTAVQYLFWEQNKHASIDFPKWYKTKRSYFQSSKPRCLTKVLWSYFTRGICVSLAECQCLISQRGCAANAIWILIAEFLPGSEGSAGSAVRENGQPLHGPHRFVATPAWVTDMAERELSIHRYNHHLRGGKSDRLIQYKIRCSKSHSLQYTAFLHNVSCF